MPKQISLYPGDYIKPFLPRSLFGRALLILVLPMLIMQSVSLYIFYAKHWTNVERHLSMTLAGDVAFLSHAMQEADPSGVPEVQQLAREMLHIDARFEPADPITSHFPSETDDAALEAFADQLRATIDRPFLIRMPRGQNRVLVLIQLPNRVLRMQFSIKRLANVTVEMFVWWMVGSAIVLLTIATVFLRNQIRPIRKLAEAAERFGKGLDSVDFRPQGASEVRQAGRSFIAMRERLKRMITGRTEMLAGISHDLRTPLTRMRLELAMIPEQKYVGPLISDVQDMERMIQEYLDFARGEGGEQPKTMKLSQLLDNVTGKYMQQGANVTLTQEVDPDVTVLYNAMRRCLSNIIDNALKYGTRCDIHTGILAKRVELTFDDDGPGIPAESRDLAMQPFKRLDPSRNLDTGGAGLGLSIVQDIMLRHGGEVVLEDSPFGGLRVRVRLPL